MATMQMEKLSLDHMVELPHCECVFCSALEEASGRRRLFLVFRERRRVYARNGLRGDWQEVTCPQEYAAVWEAFEEAVLQRRIPSFVASSMSFAGM